MNKIIQHTKTIILTLLAAASLFSCSPDWKEELDIELGTGTNQNSGIQGNRVVNEENRKVLLLYSAGFNTISSYLKG